MELNNLVTLPQPMNIPQHLIIDIMLSPASNIPAVVLIVMYLQLFVYSVKYVRIVGVGAGKTSITIVLQLLLIAHTSKYCQAKSGCLAKK